MSVFKGFFLTLIVLFLSKVSYSTEPSSGHLINFRDVQIKEFIRFVSKITEKNFIYKDEELDFTISFISGRESTKKAVLQALDQILLQHYFKMTDHGEYFVIQPMTQSEIQQTMGALEYKNFYRLKTKKLSDEVQTNVDGFHVYKLQYHKGSEIIKVVKQVAVTQKHSRDDVIKAIDTMQWVESTNSILYTCDSYTSGEIFSLIQSLDQPQKQVFIEVLVLEVDIKDGLEFGLEWGGEGKIMDKVHAGFGNFSARPRSPLANQLSKPNPKIPLGKGFDLGVIGDLILHKGKTFFSLGSLVSALQKDGKASIILNQKIITQDNKSSSIFVGDNIPFTGSIVETVGAAQQTTSNIEYKDVGVSLNITPLLGDGDVITLDIKEEISEAREDLRDLPARNTGIQTSKTNMVTQVHVPDKHFLVLSGMVKNSRTQRKSGVPCLGGLPLIGAAFSKTKTDKEKKNIIVFVRPQIIHNFDEYESITQKEYSQVRSEVHDEFKND